VPSNRSFICDVTRKPSAERSPGVAGLRGRPRFLVEATISSIRSLPIFFYIYVENRLRKGASGHICCGSEDIRYEDGRVVSEQPKFLTVKEAAKILRLGINQADTAIHRQEI
jgi:hypothetical protein